MGAITQSLGLFGVTGELGRAFFDALEEQGAFVGRLRLFASVRSNEESRVFRDKPLAVEEADTADFDDLNEAILAVPADVADELAGRLLARGVRVWDASGSLRSHPQAVSLAEAGPDSLLIVLDEPLVNILSPLVQKLNAASPLQRLEVTVLAPVSARGQKGVRELARQTGELLNGRGITVETWPQQIAFNVLSADGSFEPATGTLRERRLLAALQKQLPGTVVRVRQFIVPVFYGAVMDLRWTHADALSRADVLTICESVDHLQVHEDRDGETLPTPVSQGVANITGTLSRLQVEAQDAMACVLADPLRVGIVQPLLATLMVQG